MIAEANEACENEQWLFSPMETTAQNAADANTQLNTMINQKMEHIYLLQEAKPTITQQLDI